MELVCTLLGSMLGTICIWIPLNKKVEEKLIAFSTSALLVTSIDAMLLPALENENNLLVGIAFLMGILFVSILEKISKNTLTVSMILHNGIEGLLMGFTYTSFINQMVSKKIFQKLVIGMSLQNIGDGISTVYPLYKQNKSKRKSFLKATGIALTEFLLIGVGIILKINSLKGTYLFLSFVSAISLYSVLNEILPSLDRKEIKNVLIFLIFLWILSRNLPE